MPSTPTTSGLEVIQGLQPNSPSIAMFSILFHRHGAASAWCVWKGTSATRWMASKAPDWWSSGWPRERVDSMAEAELLSQLAVLLRPRTPIAEMFRRFPAPKGWRGNYLDPDLAVHGVLKKKDAALFVEYDGYWRHSENQGISTDHAKNAAMLKYAPRDSWVVRIGHWKFEPSDVHPNVHWITVEKWSVGNERSVSQVLQRVLLEIYTELHPCLQAHVAKRLYKLQQMDFLPPSAQALEFTSAAAVAAGGSTKEELHDVLTSAGFSRSRVEILKRSPNLQRFSIEMQIKPGLKWLLNLGLSYTQIEKVVAVYPRILGLSVENTLEPTLRWFSDLGLTRNQIAKAVTSFPQIIGLNLEHNLKPTAQWLFDLGLTKSQVAKLVPIKPQMFGYSVQQNLKPTAHWFLDLGMTKSELANAVSKSPAILGCSIEDNLIFKVKLLRCFLAKRHVAALLSKYPATLTYGFDRLYTRATHLATCNKIAKLGSGMIPPDADFYRRYPPENEKLDGTNVHGPCRRCVKTLQTSADVVERPKYSSSKC